MNLQNLSPNEGMDFFTLPDIAEDVPVDRKYEFRAATHEVARFGIAADQQGIPLRPGKKPHCASAIVEKQLSTYALRAMQEVADVWSKEINLSLRVKAQSVEFAVIAETYLPVFRLKPVVEALEAKLPGLGFWVVSQISAAGAIVPMYDPSFLGWASEASRYESKTDIEFLAEVDSDFHEDGMTDEVVEKKLQELRDSGYSLPSDLIKSVGGYEHLLGWNALPKSQFCTSEMAKVAVTTVLLDAPALANCVSDALKLETELKKVPNSFHRVGDEFSLCGAACFVVWDDPEMTQRAASEFEEYEMNTGESETLLAHFSKPHDGDLAAVTRGIVQDIQTLFHIYACTARALKHFYEKAMNES